MNSGVYQIKNLMSGDLYVGSAVDFSKRWNVHKHQLSNGTHHSAKLQRAWVKYGADAFEFSVLLQCAPDRVIVHEQGAIDFLKPAYNISPTAGSCLGVKHTKETCLKNGLAHKGNTYNVGRIWSAESRMKVSVAGKGRVCSIETRKKMSASRLGKGNPALRGRSLSAETKFKIGLKSKGNSHAKGYKHSSEARNAISRANLGNLRSLGFKHTLETRAKVSAAVRESWRKRREVLS